MSEITDRNLIKFSGYIPGMIGSITEMHAGYYHRNWGFGLGFEAEVAKELSQFFIRFDENKDFFMAASCDSRISGSIAIHGSGTEIDGARLRWFIVSEECHGKGMGKKLFEMAMDFCSAAGHRKIFLWTFKGLDRARGIYENYGFRFTEEYEDALWGSKIIHQKFILNR